MKRPIIHIIIATALLSACSGRPSDTAAPSETEASIFPDFKDVTVPRNIAPLNFMIDNTADAFYTVMSNGATSVSIRGKKVCIPTKNWNRLVSGADSCITVSIFARKGRSWAEMEPFRIHLSNDSIDRYISYRRMPLVGEYYHVLDMVQRDITGFDEKTYFSNTMIQDEGHGSCVNCHCFSNYRTDNMQFHVRQYKGGTILVIDGQPNKIELKTDSTLSSGVYPAWHPTHDYIAYSNNKTFQAFHSMSQDKIEVIDEINDIILYDIRSNTVSPVENDPNEMECYPAWSSDGRTLYYVSYHYEGLFDTNRKSRIFDNCARMRFNLYAKPFDPETRTWGPHCLVYDAAAIDSSMTWPRVSPDGRYLLACISDHGIFPLDQIASDLFIIDFKTGTARRTDEINSQFAESYHSWSSNGKWVMWSTRREDGIYTRLYFSHIDEDGHFSKPFALPQKDPEFNRKSLFAFNVAEFTIEQVRINAADLSDFIKKNQAKRAVYESKREVDQFGRTVISDNYIDGNTGASSIYQ